MRIGFDVDGVLAAFTPAYQRLFIETTGVNLFAPGDDTDPPCWNWPEFRGYTKEQVSVVWDHIRLNPAFSRNLAPLPGARELRHAIADLERRHDVYFITSRVGVAVKRQTEYWLMEHLGYVEETPTVLIVGSRTKGAMCKALRLDCYIDDNWDNVEDCACESPTTRTYLLNAAYNQQPLLEDDCPLVIRVDSVAEMLDYEMVNL